MSRPNIVIIMTDQQKATALDLYGGPVRSPQLARLAARGTLYEHAYTPHPLCVPARVAFWTGRWPHSTGARTNETPMPRGETHLAQLLHGAGYRLGLFGKNHCFTREDLDAYFDRVFLAGHGDTFGPNVTMVRPAAEPLPGPPNPAHMSTAWGYRRPVAETRTEPIEASATYRVTDEACRFLEEHAGVSGKDLTANPFPIGEGSPAARDASAETEDGGRDNRPVCLWVSIPDPHEPYQAPEPYASMYPPESVQLPPWREGELEGKPERQRVYQWLFDYQDLSAEDARLAAGMYHGMCAFIDERVGHVLDTLERLGLRDDTIVVYTSDHGDFVGEHRLLIKCNAFYDALTRVPLIVSYPGARSFAGGERRADLVSTMDVMPTLLALAGLPVPGAVQAQPLPGVAGAPAPRVAAFSEYGAGGPPVTMADVQRLVRRGQPRVLHPLLREREAHGHGKMVRTHRWKYTRDSVDGAEELYDLEADPWELTNLAGSADPSHQAALSEMRLRLADWLLDTENARPITLGFRPFWEGDAPPYATTAPEGHVVVR
jgi:arylsulfatase A-like enzyme